MTSVDPEFRPIGMAPEEPARSKFHGCLLSGLVVLTMVGVAGMVLVPRFLLAPDDGRLTACRFNCKNLGVALEMYATDQFDQEKLSLVYSDITLDKRGLGF